MFLSRTANRPHGKTITTSRDLYFVRREGGLGYGGKRYDALKRREI